ncbi:hypothetical protein MCERE10_00815 [Burkholderiaceae bacterium]
MATLRNRSGKWQARVVRKGHIPVTKTFLAKQDAERWARQVESAMVKVEQTVGIRRPAAMAQVSKFLRVSQEV